MSSFYTVIPGTSVNRSFPRRGGGGVVGSGDSGVGHGGNGVSGGVANTAVDGLVGIGGGATSSVAVEEAVKELRERRCDLCSPISNLILNMQG